MVRQFAENRIEMLDALPLSRKVIRLHDQWLS
jgi:hypothetical protein